MKKIYFKGLTEVRAIAAFFVIFHHVELYKFRDGLPSLYNSPLKHFISHLGKNGVYIFFVLSGFLITYLLLSEKTLMNKINIRKFYIRRILRIWPLYYLIILISFTLIPFLANNFSAFQNEQHYYNRILLLIDSPYSTLILFLLFLPNLALMLKPTVVGAAHSWSVGVEEQFYLIWPHIVTRIKNNLVLLLVFSIICILPLMPNLIKPYSITLSKYLNFAIILIPIHFMAIGGIGSVILFYYKSRIQKILNNKLLFILNTIVLIIFLFLDITTPLKPIAFGFVVLIEILFITRDNFRINLRNKYLEKTGDISYGIYMYHPLVMYICFSFFNTIFPVKNMLLYNCAIYISIISITLIISNLSYKYYERKFILLKNRKFTILASGKTTSNNV